MILQGRYMPKSNLARLSCCYVRAQEIPGRTRLRSGKGKGNQYRVESSFLSQHMYQFRTKIDIRIKCIGKIGERSSYACLLNG
jgi:hypothetical protein